MSLEAFTVLAILEARDQASEIFGRVDESLDKFSATMKSAADTARAGGEAIDEGLLQTASGADALDLADARVARRRRSSRRRCASRPQPSRNYSPRRAKSPPARTRSLARRTG